jgi:hypothetical protein
MHAKLTQKFIAQIDAVVTDYNRGLRSASDMNPANFDAPYSQQIIARGVAVIERVSGRESAYSRQIPRVLESGLFQGQKAAGVVNIALALKSDLETDALETAAELLHGELFADFMEMAQHLLSEGYKDASAVVAGAALESHLRQLCHKNSIPTDVSTNGQTRPKKADSLNSDLAGVNTITKLDQKSVTAWLDLRNKAAHGRFNEYTKEQVELVLSGIRDFMLRHPA